MDTVASSSSQVNPSSLEEVCLWHQTKAERGEITPNAARLRITALTQLATILDEDERARDAKWFHDNIGDIAARWARKKMSNSGTTAAYTSRAKAALTDYLRWQENPAHFRFHVREVTRDGAAGKEAKKPKARPMEAPRADHDESVAVPIPVPNHAAPPTIPATLPAAGVMPRETRTEEERRSFPMGAGREPFYFVLPKDGITVKDMKRIACHLLTLATDFDPTTPSHQQVFSIVSQRTE